MTKILVVDDDEGILDAVSMVLEQSGYEVETSIKGDQIYKIVNKFQPDIILLDVLMSGVDGRHICQQLKQKEETKKIPIIMISAHPSAGKSARDFGADDFLAKPFEVADLLKKIRSFRKK